MRQLDGRCTKCRGRGFIESPPFMEWADEDTPVLSTIKRRCSCRGTALWFWL